MWVGYEKKNEKEEEESVWVGTKGREREEGDVMASVGVVCVRSRDHVHHTHAFGERGRGIRAMRECLLKKQ